jgi:hypothetical protein
MIFKQLRNYEATIILFNIVMLRIMNEIILPNEKKLSR